MLKNIKHSEKFFDDMIELENGVAYNSKFTIPIRLIVRTTLQVANKKGFVPKNDSGIERTSDVVARLIKGGPDADDEVRALGIVGPYDVPDTTFEELVDSVIDYYKKPIGRPVSSFEEDMRKIYRSYDVVFASDIGRIAASCRKFCSER